MQAEDQFVERMGQLYERDGLARIAGRIFGQLLLAVEPMSLDDLVAALRVSKASVSTNTRLLDRLGVVERVTLPGDRRDYYQVTDRVHERMLEPRVQRLHETRKLLLEGLETEAAEDPRVQRRLEQFGEFFDRMVEVIEDARSAMADDEEGEGR